MITGEQSDRGRPVPTRRCIVSGAVRPRGTLLRFAVSAEGTVTPDLSCRLPGRGIWVESVHESLRLACDRNLFARAARRSVRPIDGLVDLVGEQLFARCLDLLRLGRRADEIAVGHDQVAAALLHSAAATTSQQGVLVTAVDASSRASTAADRLAAMARYDVGRVRCLTADDLGRPFDRARIVHLLIKPGRLAERFLQEATRLAGIRPGETREVGRR